jgi:hypothetical protein
MREKVTRFLFLLTGTLLFIYLVFQLGPEEIFSWLREIGWNFVLVALLFCTYQLIRAAALFRCLLGKQRLSYWGTFWIQISGETVKTLTLSGPFLGEPLKAVLLRKRGFSTEAAFAAALTEYLIYTFSSALMVLAGLIYLTQYYSLRPSVYKAGWILIGLAGAFLIVAAFAIGFRLYLIGALMKGIARLPFLRNRFNWDAGAVHRMEDFLLVILRERPVRFLEILGTELVAQCLLVFELYWIIRTLNVSCSILHTFLIEAATKSIPLVFFFIPWQVGAAEGAYTLVFYSLGYVAAAGFAVSIVRRLRSLFLAGLGLISTWLLTKPKTTVDGTDSEPG